MLLTLFELDISPVGVLFAIGLVTILPGYAITTAIFINMPLGIMEKIAFSFGFSLGMTSLGGLILNYFPWGIQSSSWVILLGGISILASGLALVRMKYTEEVDVRVVHVPLRADQILLMLLAVAIMVGAYVYARVGARENSLPSPTRMWMLWDGDSRTEVVLGIENQDSAPATYRLVLSTLQGQIHEWTEITLAPGTVWEVRYEVPSSIAESDFIKAVLYMSNAPESEYRQVYLRRVSREAMPHNDGN
jgi:uncharacterized membrane protein